MGKAMSTSPWPVYLIFFLLTYCASSSTTEAVPIIGNADNIERKTTTISKTNSLWTDCSTSSDPMTIYSLSISPTPLRRGSEVHAVMTANLDEKVNGGKVSIVLRYSNIMTVLRKRFHLCTFVKKSGLTCPLSKGTLTLTYSTFISSSIPPGQYTGSIIATNKNGKELACVSLNLNMGV